MTTKDFKRLFSYEFWANRVVVDALDDDNEGAVRLFSHILASQSLWLCRMTGRPQAIPVWPSLSAEECRTVLLTIEHDWRDYLDTLSDASLADSFDYVNTKGESWTSSVGDTLLHLITHSCYHRGQIAHRIRLAGQDPPYTDFIHVTRHGLI